VSVHQLLSQNDPRAANSSPRIEQQLVERVLVAGLQAHERAAAFEAALDRMAFLDSVGQRLSACLESPTIIQTLVDMVVPDLADAATVRLIDPARRDPRTAFATSDRLGPRPLEWLDWLDRAAERATRRVLQRGSAQLGSTRRTRAAPPTSSRHFTYLVVPLSALGRTLGTLALFSLADGEPYGPDQRGLCEALGMRAGLAIRNAQVCEAQVGTIARLERLRSSSTPDDRRNWVDERRRFGRELHDGLEQTLFAIGLTGSAALANVPGNDVSTVPEALRQIVDLARSGAEQLRSAIFALSQDEPHGGRLIPDLFKLTRAFQQRAGVQADLAVSGPKARVPARAAEALRAIAREALANVERHAHASAVVLGVHFSDDVVLFTVHDDGVGPPPLLLERLGHSTMHFGLRGMHERVEQLGGTFVAGRGPDGGFVVSARVPLRAVRA
jgi:signal transduction histidine kinase